MSKSYMDIAYKKGINNSPLYVMKNQGGNFIDERGNIIHVENEMIDVEVKNNMNIFKRFGKLQPNYIPINNGQNRSNIYSNQSVISSLNLGLNITNNSHKQKFSNDINNTFNHDREGHTIDKFEQYKITNAIRSER